MNARVLTAEAGASVVDRLRPYLDPSDAAPFAAAAEVAVVVLDEAPPGARDVADAVATRGGVAHFDGARLVVAAPAAVFARVAGDALGVARAVAREVERAVVASARTPARLRLRDRVLDLVARPRVMGILNVTPDSFYDGGRYTAVDRARERAAELVELGADVLDIGGQSYADARVAVDEADEAERVVPVVEALVRDGLDVALSIDTHRSGVAQAALDAGAHCINDCSGLLDPRLAHIVARYDAALVVMHIKGALGVREASYRYGDVMAEILGFLRVRLDRARAAGVAAEALVCDPGLEFGKELEADLEILACFGDLRSLGVPTLLAASRKSFIGRLFDAPARDLLVPSLASAAAGIVAGAALVRVHDVAETVQLATMLAALRERNRGFAGSASAALVPAARA